MAEQSTNVGGAQGYRPLEGKLALVTGASRGIGNAIAHNLASKGASLILNYTSNSSTAAANELSSTLTATHGVRCLVLQADMSTPTGPAHIINTAKEHFADPKTGVFQLDILINNAGVSRNTTLAGITLDDFDWQYKVNVLGPLLLVQAALPYLPHDRSGRIVNVSSVSSSSGFIGQTVYGGTKAALEAMTRTWARELGERATVNAINPGPVKTEMWFATTDEFQNQLKPWIQGTPGSRIRPEVDDKDLVDSADKAGGRPAYATEIAGIVGMLSTADSAWCTGQVVSANGGMRMSG